MLNDLDPHGAETVGGRAPSQLAGPVGLTTDATVMADWIGKFGKHPLAFLVLLNGGELFVCAGVGAVGFFRHGNGVLAVGGALTSAQDHSATIREFLLWCHREGLKPRFIHFPPETAAALAAEGFKVDQLGASYSLEFGDTGLKGGQYRQVRRKLNKAKRLGVTVERIETQSRFEELLPTFHEVNRQWLRQKGGKHLRLLVCDLERMVAGQDTLMYAAWHKGELVAYLIFSKTLGEDSGWFHNLSRRKTGCVDGTMQLIMARLMQDISSGTVHFGFTPLVEITDAAYPHSKVAGAIIRLLCRLGGVLYPARSQRQYKMSWCPTQTMPEYFAYQGSSIKALVWFLRATNSL